MTQQRTNSRPASPTTDLALIATFTAIIAVTSVVSIPIGAVPITLQTFSVLLAGAVLGAQRGALSVLLYLVLGGIGLPIFAGGSAGFAVFFGPTAGYLLGMPFAAWLTGWLVQRIPPLSAPKRGLRIFCFALLSELLFMHTLGIAVLMWRLQLTLQQAVLIDLAFIPGALIKVALVAVVAAAVHRAFPALLPQPGSTRRASQAAPAHPTAHSA